jgi:hypothetical protein
MSDVETTSHFWVAAPPLFSSALLVASGADTSGTGRVRTAIEIFDLDGKRVNSVEVEFPANEVGFVELEPFTAALKMQGGVAHGHLKVTSPLGTRHLYRQTVGNSLAVSSDPEPVRNKESAFIPLVVGKGHEHMLVLVNSGEDEGQIACRIFFGNRSPEWTLTVPGNGSRIVALESDLLASSDDKSWEKSPLQAYVRLSGRQGSAIAGHIIERVVGESPDQDRYRSLTSWGS